MDPLAEGIAPPTPPPSVDERVLSAARAKATGTGSESPTHLPKATQRTYDNGSKQRRNAREQTMSDNIVFPCPACGTKYSVGPHHAGKKTSCKKCGAALTVPQPNVQNPTIVGGTRTIRRADMAPSVSERKCFVLGKVILKAAAELI